MKKVTYPFHRLITDTKRKCRQKNRIPVFRAAHDAINPALVAEEVRTEREGKGVGRRRLDNNDDGRNVVTYTFHTGGGAVRH